MQHLYMLDAVGMEATQRRSDSAIYVTVMVLFNTLIAKSAIFRYYVSMKQIDKFTDNVIQEIEKKRLERGMSVAELIRRIGMTRSTFFRKMRGDTYFTTSDIDAIANALGCDALLLLREAAKHPTDEERIVARLIQQLKESTQELAKNDPQQLAAYIDKGKDQAIDGEASGQDYDDPA